MGDASSPIPAGAGRPPVTDPDARVRVEAVRRLFAYSAPAHLLAIPAAFFIAAMFGQVTATGIVWGWAIALATVECARLGLYLVFRAAGDHVADSLRWQRLFFAGMLISALTWGAAGIIFFHPELPLMQLLLAAMLVAVSGIALPLLAPVLHACCTYVLVVLAPVSALLLFSSHTLSGIGAVLMMLAAAVMLTAAVRINRDQIDAIRTRYAY
jgi:hypothetical protein